VINTGIFTDQFMFSTMRSLADESFAVSLAEDCGATGPHVLHHQEPAVINMINFNVKSSDEQRDIMNNT
jgi:nicotinamidase-related amidase